MTTGKYNIRRLNAVSYLAMATLGMYLSAYQFALADITAEFALYAWASGLLIAMHFTASFFIPPIAGEIADRIGRKPVLLGGFALMAAGILCAALSNNIYLLAFGALITGGAANTIESSMSSLLSQCNPDEESRVMNLSQMYFCGGAVLSPLYGGLLARFGLDWRVIYATVILIVLLCTVIVASTKLPAAPPRTKGLYFGKILKRPFYVLMVGGMLLYVGIEESAAFWSGSYAKLAGEGIESVLLAVYWLGMGIGRLLVSNVKKRLGVITIAGLALSALSFGAMLLFHSSAAFIACYALAGFTLAPAWPLIMVCAGKVGADVPDTAAGGIMAAGSAGGILIPFLLGLVQTASGMRASFALLAAIVVVETVILGFSKEFRNI
ncbi:MAG: MFS transporter [Clostridiaceae bacterium]|nr:MFS transporter [Clostridiaceae bacterium]